MVEVSSVEPGLSKADRAGIVLTALDEYQTCDPFSPEKPRLRAIVLRLGGEFAIDDLRDPLDRRPEMARAILTFYATSKRQRECY